MLLILTISAEVLGIKNQPNIKTDIGFLNTNKADSQLRITINVKK